MHVPLLHIDPSRRIPDLLHINLRVVAHLYWQTSQRHCGTSEADIEALQDWMLATIDTKSIIQEEAI
jgi:hypothetical protein